MHDVLHTPRPAKRLVEEIFQEATRFLDRNLLVRPLGPVVYTLPPYVSEPDQVDRVWDALAEMLDS